MEIVFINVTSDILIMLLFLVSHLTFFTGSLGIFKKDANFHYMSCYLLRCHCWSVEKVDALVLHTNHVGIYHSAMAAATVLQSMKVNHVVSRK